MTPAQAKRLKVGDKVVLNGSYHDGIVYTVTKILARWRPTASSFADSPIKTKTHTIYAPLVSIRGSASVYNTDFDAFWLDRADSKKSNALTKKIEAVKEAAEQSFNSLDGQGQDKLFAYEVTDFIQALEDNGYEIVRKA